MRKPILVWSENSLHDDPEFSSLVTQDVSETRTHQNASRLVRPTMTMKSFAHYILY